MARAIQVIRMTQAGKQTRIFAVMVEGSFRNRRTRNTERRRLCFNFSSRRAFERSNVNDLMGAFMIRAFGNAMVDWDVKGQLAVVSCT